jgi:hypothetical protein
MPIRAVAPIAAAVALCLSSLSAIAAEIKPAELLEQAKAEQSAYIETVKQLVAVDTGTGQAEGLATVSKMLVERLQALGAQVSTSPATTPPMFSRRLSPSGSPNSATASAASPMARTAKVAAPISVLRRVSRR